MPDQRYTSIKTLRPWVRVAAASTLFLSGCAAVKMLYKPSPKRVLFDIAKIDEISR
jgi:hypothetical protein